MTVTFGRLAATVLVVFLAACGPGGSTDGGGDDAAIDTSPQDAGPQCPEYCACVMTQCPMQLPSGRSCLDFCQSFGAAARMCRFNQCVQVMMNPALASTHCPDTVGTGGVCM